MDELDTEVTSAKQSIEPRKDFVETTMKQIDTIKPRRRVSRKIWIPSAAGGAVLVVAAILLLPLIHTKQSDQTSQPSTSQTQQVPSQASGADTTTPPSSVSDSSLQSDLDSINSSMNQENTDQNSADSNLNDSSQQITVPSS